MKRILLTMLFFGAILGVHLSGQAQIITTIAGNGTSGYTGDGALALNATVGYPYDVAVDASGNLYILDGQKYVLRKIDKNTGIISTIAGTGIAGYNGENIQATQAQLQMGSPGGALAIDASGNIYIADNYRIRKINTLGYINTIAGTGVAGSSGNGGFAINALIGEVWGLAVDASGNLYLAELNNHVVRKIDTNGYISIAVGTGTPGFSGDNTNQPTSAMVSGPYHLAIDASNNLYIADNGNSRIRKVNLTSGLVNTVAGNGTYSYGGDGLTATSGSFSPFRVAVDGSSNIYIEDPWNNNVRKVTNSNQLISRFAGAGPASPLGFSGDYGAATLAQFYYLSGLAVDNSGNVYMGDGANNRIRKVWGCITSLTSPSTAAQTVCQNGTVTPLTIGATGGGSFTYQWYSNTVNKNSGGAPISGATSTSYTPPSSIIGDNYYYATVTGSCGTLATTVSGLIRINTTIALTSQPSTTPQTVCLNGAATPLSVTVSGSSTPIFQWYKNATNSNSGGTAITGATSSSYTPNGLTGTFYYYVIATGCNSITSTQSGAITVNSTTITSQQYGGTQFTVCQNATFPYTFSVVAAGPGPLTYQWYKGPTTSTSAGTPISGATSASYLAPASSTIGLNYYYVIVTGACGTATSAVSGIDVIAPPSITVQPSTAAATVCVNGTLPTLSVTAANTVYSYTWYKNTANNNTTGSYISGATSSTYTPPANVVGTFYYYVVVNGCSPVTSAPSGALTVNPSTTITTQPSGAQQYVCQNAAASPVSVTATGPGLTYQWYVGTSWYQYTGTAIPGATSASYTPSTATTGVFYHYAVVSGTCGTVNSQISGGVVVSITNIIQQPQSIEVAQNGSATLYEGISGPPSQTHQWYSNTTNSNSGGTAIPGATSYSYNPPTSTIGKLYYYLVTNGCTVVTSNVASVTVLPPQVITRFAGTGTAGYSGDNGDALLAQFNVVGDLKTDASGNVYVADNNVIRKISTTGIITTIAGNGTTGYTGENVLATTATLDLQSGGIAVDAAGNIFIAQANNNVIRKINSSGYISTIAGNGTYGFGGDGGPAASATFRTPSDIEVDASGNLYIVDQNNSRIRKIDTGGYISTIAGTATPGYNSDGILANMAQLSSPLDLAISGSNMYIADYGNRRVRKIDLTSGYISTIAGDGTYNYSGDGGLANVAAIIPVALATDAGGNVFVSQTQSYVVRKIAAGSGIITRIAGSFSSGFGGDYGSAVSAQLQAPGRLAFDGNGNLYISDDGNKRIRKVYSCFTFVTVPSSTGQIVCQNVAAAPLTVSASGGGSFTYQWYSNTANANTGGSLIGGATAASYTPVTTTAGTTYYYAVITGTCGWIRTSVSGAITVNPSTVITAQPSTASQTICYGGTFTPLTITATGNAPIAYKWYMNTTASTVGATQVAGATASTYTPYQYTIGTYYYYATATGSSCNTATSGFSGAITVNPPTQFQQYPSTTTRSYCQNTNGIALTVATTGTNVTWQWYQNTSPQNTGGTAITGATALSYTPTNNTVGTFYYYCVATGTCGTQSSVVSGGHFISPATAFTANPSSAGQSVCLNAPATPLSVTATGTGTVTYQWYSNTTAQTAGATLISGATSSTYTPPTSATGVKYYYAIASSGCPSATSAFSGAITVNPPTSITTHPSTGTQTTCVNTSVAPLSVAASGLSLTYQWYSTTNGQTTGGIAIGGATGTTYTPSSATAGTLYYYAIATGACSSATSNSSGAITISNTPPTITVSPAVNFCPGQSATLTASGAGTGGTYTWSPSTALNTTSGSSVVASPTSSITYTVTGTNSIGCTGTNTVWVNVTMYNQSISFGGLPGKTYGDGAFGISASASSGLGVSFGSSNPSVASVAGNIVTIVGAGSTTITAYQGGNSCFNAATPVSQTLTVNKADQVVYFDPPGTICGGSMTLSAWTSSNLSNFYFASSNPEQIYVTGNMAYGYYGAAYIQAYEPGNQNYNQAWSISRYVTVGPTYGSISQSCSLSSCGYAYLYAGGGSNWNWDDGYTGQARYVYASGNYTVTYLSNGCWVTASSYVDGCAGCEPYRVASDRDGQKPAVDDAATHLFGVSPNPASDQITITLSKVALEDSPVSIRDLSGKQVLQGTIEKGRREKQFPTNDLPAGLYLVIIQDVIQERYRKLVIVR